MSSLWHFSPCVPGNVDWRTGVDQQTESIGESYSHDVRHALLILEKDILAEIHKQVIFSCRRILGNVHVATEEGQDAPVKDHTLTLIVPDL